MLALSSADAAVRAEIDLCWALRNPSPASPLAPVGNAQMQVIAQLEHIFSASVRQPVDSAPPAPIRPPSRLEPAVVCIQHSAARAAPRLPPVAVRAAAPIATPPADPGAHPPPRADIIDPENDYTPSAVPGDGGPLRVALPPPRVPTALIFPDDDGIHRPRYPTRSRRVAGQRMPVSRPGPRPESVALLAALAAALEHSASSVVYEKTGENLSIRTSSGSPTKNIGKQAWRMISAG